MGELPRDPKNIPLWIVRSIQASEPAAGLAILIGRGSSRVPFKGDSEITHDLHALGRTFEELRFTVLSLLNPSKAQLVEVIKSVLNLKKCGIEWPSSWRRIVVAYSGAGSEIASENGKHPMDIDYIVQDLLNSDQKQLKCIPKIFFMDFNRGFVGDKGVEVVTDASSFQVGPTAYPPVGVSNTFSQGELVSRGNSRIPSKGNYLLAYSAQKNMKSCSARGGSYWIQTLSKFLVDKNLIDLDIENILKRVNIYLIKNVDSLQMHFLQQPEYISALNEDVKLLKEAEEILHPQLQQFQQQQQQQQQLMQQPQGMSQYLQQQQQQQLTQYQQQLQMPQYQQQQQQQQQQLMPQQLMHHQYMQQIPEGQQHELSQNDLLGPDIFDPDIQALLEGTTLDELDPNSLNVHQPVQQPQHSAYPISYKPAYDEQYSYGRNSLELHGRGEEAAKDDLKDDSTGAAKSFKSSKGEKQSKAPKTILKEYFEGKSKDKVKVQYKTIESTNSFTSTVIGPEFGTVKGDAQPTKKQAENSAASKALSKLNLI